MIVKKIESYYTGAKFHCQMPFILLSKFCSSIKAVYSNTFNLNNPFQKKILFLKIN